MSSTRPLCPVCGRQDHRAGRTWKGRGELLPGNVTLTQRQCNGHTFVMVETPLQGPAGEAIAHRLAVEWSTYRRRNGRKSQKAERVLTKVMARYGPS